MRLSYTADVPQVNTCLENSCKRKPLPLNELEQIEYPDRPKSFDRSDLSRLIVCGCKKGQPEGWRGCGQNLR